MSRCVSCESKIMANYKKLTPSGPHQLTPEMQSALDAADKPERGKKPKTTKPETEGPSSPKKRKKDKAAPSAPKRKKVKKMAKRPKAPSHADSNNDEQSAEVQEDVHHEDSPRGNTPPWSPTPQLQDDIPTPPHSPKKPLYQSPLLPFHHLFLLTTIFFNRI